MKTENRKRKTENGKRAGWLVGDREFRNPNSELRMGKIRNPQATFAVGFSLAVLPLLARAERRYRAIPKLPAVTRTADLPSLSIIVPARDEEQNLRRLLPSLQAQEYPGRLEIIVVDDHSSDGTAKAVECGVRSRECRMALQEHRGERAKCVRLIQTAEVPQGWLGKQNASHTGACAARGQWLLFTDADTEHLPFSAASAVAFAEAHGLDGLSLFPRQSTRGLLDSAVLMVAFAGLFAGLRRSTTMLNGQFILVRHDVYERSGGFAAVRTEMMDDLAFGRLLAGQGYRAPMMRGEALVGVHMYDDGRQMWQGVTRLGSGTLRHNGLMALVPALFITGVMMPIWTLLINRRYVREIRSLWLMWLAAVAGFFPWARRFNNQQKTINRKRKTALTAVMAPPAAVFVQVSALWGMISRLLGVGVSWKDRKVGT